MLHRRIQFPPSPPMTPPVQLKMPTDPPRLDRQAVGLQTSVPTIWLQANARVSDANEQNRNYLNIEGIVSPGVIIPTVSHSAQACNHDLLSVTRNTPGFHELPYLRPYSTPLGSGGDFQTSNQLRNIWPAVQADDSGEDDEENDSYDADQASVAGRSVQTASERKEPKRRHRLACRFQYSFDIQALLTYPRLG